MFKEVLSDRQLEMLNLVSAFAEHYYLVGGTAIALQIGHRQSIDFDLFSEKSIKPNSIKSKITSKGYGYKVIYEEFEQLHLLIHSVKFTFFTYPFKVDKNNQFESIIKMPSLLSLAAMKALALGERANLPAGKAGWKDYVDMFFLLKEHFTIAEIENRAYALFASKFSAKLFRQQLAYFEDIDYSEKVIFVRDKPEVDEIQNFLIEVSIDKI